MSFMKKMLGQRSSDDAGQTQDNNLGLMHLRKLFTEFRHPTVHSTQKNQEEKLYSMLPLFIKVFEKSQTTEMAEKWSDVLQFCSHVSKLMVTEIKRRASNQSTEAASCAIVQLLEMESTAESGSGWMLLTAINLLSQGGNTLIDCMTAACLPSTLVKCVYLFFDLPPVENADQLEPGCEFSPLEKRILLQKVFVQILVRLCSHTSPAEELARKDDLSLLFSAITSWCPAHNIMWRQSAGEVLVTLSRHGLTQQVVNYIHEKGCVRHCIENMQRAQDLSPLELVEMFVTVFCFLKDSSEVSQILLDDFRSCQGYNFLSDFLLKLEQDTSEETIQALRNLVLLVGSLTTCGFTEMKPSHSNSGSLFQLPGFSVPIPSGKGVSVRNLHAFLVLQSVFIKSNTSHLCNTILDVISSIYHQDNANYFILESQHTLPQFAEKIYVKPEDIQIKFFELLEFLVFNLNFVPCKELISISLLIKSQHSIDCSILCLKSLLRILRYHSVYRDVFREVGMLEVLGTCLHRYAAQLKEQQNETDAVPLSDEQQELGMLVMEALAVLLSSNSQNAGVFRECGGARCAHNMVPFQACRPQALHIVQQLVLSPGGDDDMGTLLGLMPTASTTDLELKTHILKSLLSVLRESHRTRTVFRKVGGFVYVMSVLVSMEGCLNDPPKSPWDTVERKDILAMLRTVFSTLTVAMRYEPANAKFFASEVRYDSLTEAIRLLGCFSATVDIPAAPEGLITSESLEPFTSIFAHCKEEKANPSIPTVLISATIILRFLYDMALDAFDKPSPLKTDSPCLKKHTSVIEESSSNSVVSSSPPAAILAMRPKSGSTGSLSLNLTSGPDPLLIHSGAVLSIFHLLPALEDPSSVQSSLDLKMFVADLLKSLLRNERNQQIMCDAGFPHELLSHGSAALSDESHPLHIHLQYMFERLASQSLTPRDLRDFLRLGSPLSCRSVGQEFIDDRSVAFVDFDGMTSSLGMEEKPATVETEKRLKSAGGTVPLTRVKCLVSMTTPRDSRMHGSTVTPAFVEFDMSAEGFSCLYLPSIAPQGPPAPSVVGGVVGTAELAVIGGIGTGERVFPPQSGLTYSTWFCVDKFSVFASDAHPVRLLTVVRNLQGRDENLICLNVSLMSKDRALIVTTQENYMPNSGNGCEIEQEPPLNDNTVRFWCPELTQEGQWHHLVVVLHRAGIMKNSNISMFVDGELLQPQKLHYISPNLGGGGTASPTAFTSVFAYIGTPPQLRRQSRLLWRQGPCFMLEDIVTAAMVKNVFDLGPTYVGSLQAPLTEEGDASGPFIGEEKVMFGVFAHAMSQMTIAKIRKIYNKVDSKTIAKQLAMSAHENATPIRILHNSAAHLAGPARCLGAVLMGYLGVRTFCPRPVARMLENVGGTSTLLGLIAMAKDVESLYAAVKALVCVVRSHTSAMWDMARIQGYQLLAMLYKKKRHLLNSHILHLTFSLVGTLDSGRETAVIPNLAAFQDLLCDLEIWHEAPGDLQRSLYEHFYELLTDSSEVKSNHSIMRQMGLITKLLHILHDPRLPLQTVQTIANVLGELLAGPLDHSGLLRFGQFLVSTLPVASFMEKSLDRYGLQQENDGSEQGDECTLAMMVHNIEMRNMLLDVVLKLVKAGPGGTGINQQACDDLQRILGYDWLLLFMRTNLHSDTVTLALQILLVTFRNAENIKRFREGSFGGGWMGGTESVLRNQMSTMLGFNVGASTKDHDREISHDVCHVPGFQALQWLLAHHTGVTDVYYLLMSLLLGQQCRVVKSDGQPLSMDSVWTVIFGIAMTKPTHILSKDGMDVCPDAALVLLAMIRHMLNSDNDSTTSSQLASLQTDETQCSVTIIQFLTYLYHNVSEFQVICTSPDFLTGLVSTLFPYPPTDSGSDVTTPQEEFKPFPDSEGLCVVKTPEDDGIGGFLTSHPARRFVIDFIRTIIMDSLSQMSNTKTSTVLDIMLDAFPEHASRAQQRQFQTEMLKILMKHLLASDVLLGDQAALPIMSGSGYSQMATSVFYLASRIVDKMWHGVFTGESKDVFEFLSKLISQAKRKATGISLEPLYKCLNRTILFQLSRPINSTSSQVSVLEALCVITNNRNLVFGPGNHDNEFLGCLCYCLLQLTEDPETSGTILSEPKARMTTWHVDPDMDDNDPASGGSGTGDLGVNEIPPALQQGMHLVAGAAKRVWDELYICKKPVLEDIFRTQLNNNSPSKNIATPDLNAVRLLIQEPASKIWVAYAENERKSSFLQFEKLQNQIQSKLQKVGSGVTGVLRLASRRTKRDFPLKSSPVSNVHMNDFYLATINHTTLVKDVTMYQHDQYLQTQKHLEKYLTDDWNQMEKELLRVRSLWGPPTGSRLDKFVLDVTEGPFRMRKKMMKNDVFYTHYPFRPNLEESPLRYKIAISHDSKAYYEHFWPQGILCMEAEPIQGTSDADLITSDPDISRGSAEDVNNLKKLLPKSSLTPTKSTGEDDDNDDISNMDSQTAELERSESTSDRTDGEGSQGEAPSPNTKADNRTILHFIGEKERISHMFRCARIQGLDTAEGLLLFGKDHFYVIDGFTLLRTKEIKDIDSLPYEVLHDPIIPKSTVGSGGNLKRMYSRFAYDDIREVHKRRYLLQPIAIEVFSGDGRNHLLAFPRKIRNKVLAKFHQVATAMTDNIHESVSGQRQNAKVEAGGGIISNLIGEKTVTQRWEKGEISNFQYLMHLNTLAGRSYNDLMQYPVFPWIIANYETEDLDLSKAANFRDLSKPMGAQTPDRLRQFQKRYTEWDDPQGETPPYHYGTHYSSAMIVASYLVRMEPFTQHFLKLQGGHFDLADRMFHSIGENWLSASKNNMADVKELIPEFFYLPDFLLNKNSFDLGTKQNGVALGDVILPPWAKGDPKEFIRIHREALECDYVSAHLHEWIDLIFGCKQCGPAAVDAVNVFHHLFYEGNVDIYTIDDPLKKNATIGFINNFGQIPKQLFKKPHPQKRLNVTVPSVFFHHVDNLKPAMQPMKELKGAVGQIHHADKYLLAVEQNKVLIPPLYSRYLAWGFSDLSIRIGHYESDKAITFRYLLNSLGAYSAAAVRHIRTSIQTRSFTAYSQAVLVFEGLDNGEILCASCPNDKIFITGGTSCVVNVWEYSSKERRAVLKQPLYGHTEPVTCLTSSAAYSLIISGSRDRTCILWDMSRLAYACQLRGHVAPVAAVAINDLTGDIATCAGTFLHIWNVNGEAIASVNTATGRSQQILCVSMSQLNEWDDQNVILTGSSDGVVRMWSVEYVQVPKDPSLLTNQSASKEETATSPTSSLSQTMNMARKLSQQGNELRSAIRRLSRHGSCDSYSDGKPATDLLKDFKDPDYLSAIECELGSSGEHDSPLAARLREEESEGWDEKGVYGSTLSTRSSSSDLSRPTAEDGVSVDEGGDTNSNLSAGDPSGDGTGNRIDTADVKGTNGNDSNTSETAGTIRRSESSHSDFVIINDSDVSETKKRPNSTHEDILKKYKPLTKNSLREGFCWQRQVVFRSKLTMHTAYERKDNKEPASITSIALSKDHRGVYVGDVKGRIWSWTVTNQPGRVVADHWVKDDGAESCPTCGVKFSFSERKHHCRNCGHVFCSKCSCFETEIKRLRIFKPVRVCQACYNILKAQQATESKD